MTIKSFGELPPRFWAKVERDLDAGMGSGCWYWTGAVSGSNGYGQYWTGERLVLAHRACFEASEGPIPVRLFACHKCDNRRCVRPSHIFVGTAKDNMQDCRRKGRMGMPDGLCRRGHAMVGANIVGEQCRTCRDTMAEARRRRRGARPHGETFGAGNHQARLTETQAMEILTFIGKESATRTALRYGVARSTVRDIQTGTSWPYLLAAFRGQP